MTTELENLKQEVDSMLAIQAGITTVLAALIQKHPDHNQQQLWLTSLLEQSLEGAWSQMLNPRQQEMARNYVEHLQSLVPVTGKIQPIDSLHQRKPEEPS